MKPASRLGPLLCVVILGCSESTAISLVEPAVPYRSAVTGIDSSGVDELTLGLAKALSEPKLRRILLEDLRDAPSKRHALHLSSYFGGTRGRQITTAIAEAQQSPSTVSGLVIMASGLELLMPRPMDRVSWKGNDDLLIVAQTKSTASYRVSDRAFAFDLSGNRMSIAAFSAPRPKILVVRPIETSFGPDPESERLAAPKYNRETISTKDEEYLLMQAQTQPHLEEDPGGGGAPVGHVLPSYFTTETCRGTGQDSDGDGLLDQCEYEFAVTFAPQLSITNSEWCATREPNWAVRPTAGVYRSVTIFYALGYYLDCGSYGHVGDSEFIILRVDEYSSSGSWRLYNVTMSAHWHYWLGDRTATYAASDIEYGNDAQFGKPLVWVSKGKHANYRSQSICNAEWWNPIDNCGDSHLEFVDAGTGTNVGQSSAQTVSSVYSRAGQPGVEKYWDTYWPFCGWQQRNYECATAYNDMLYFYGF